MSTVLLLAGGKGTRLRGLFPDLPKSMVPVAGRPFLEWQVAYWRRQGVERMVVSVGYLASVIENRFAGRLEFVRETVALGTGGAVREAARRVELDDPFWVANADSLLLADLPEVVDPAWDGALVGIEVGDASRYGTLEVGGGGRLRGFHEKRPGRGLINGGIYLIRHRLLARFPAQTPLSIELEVFPALLASGAVLGVIPVRAPFLDIGTPESYAEAPAFVERFFNS